MDEPLFDLWVIDGHFSGSEYIDAPLLDYRCLTYKQAMSLQKLSLEQGFEVIICVAETEETPEEG